MRPLFNIIIIPIPTSSENLKILDKNEKRLHKSDYLDNKETISGEIKSIFIFSEELSFGKI